MLHCSIRVEVSECENPRCDVHIAGELGDTDVLLV